uniref:NADH dehydrogenase subunit 6 n=1 Tax=Gynaikothrips uzeli TaxID=1422814 RepID=A0A8A5L6Y5_9NEOP|nr:NADH dehydrogenase subunit 6 [Gynaikothrips uzeli]
MNMIVLFLLLFFITMSCFFFLKHPLALGFLLILSTMFLSIFVSLFSFSSWNSYILFLMFLGGILILFLYNISLISTEIFLKFEMYNYIIIILLFFFFKSLKETHFNDTLEFFSQKEISSFTFFFFNKTMGYILFMVTYLFLSLICIVNLVYLMKDKGSMK